MFDNKCRAKRKDNEKWTVGYHVFDKQHYILHDLYMVVRGTPELVNLVEVEPETLGRCSYMTDKTGQVIYEGNIVSWFDTENLRYVVRFGRFANAVGTGYYSGVGFYLELCDDYKHTIPIDAFKCENLYVKGNIVDNPDLLKREKKNV